METITIQANESFIKEIKAIIKEKAKALNEQVSFKNDPIKEELNIRADEALQGKGLIDEKEALKKFESIKNGSYAQNEEDKQLARLGEKAYQEYLESGEVSYSSKEVFKELGI